MATTSLWKVENRLDKVIKYTTNIEKTKNENYETNFYRDLHNTIEYAKADFKTEEHRNLVERLMAELEIEVEVIEEGSQILEGKSFAITGSLEHFENRNQLKEKIESLGGKVTGSVTGKTFALINNDATSNSSKNKKARELGVQILTESEFLQQYVNR